MFPDRKAGQRAGRLEQPATETKQVKRPLVTLGEILCADGKKSQKVKHHCSTCELYGRVATWRNLLSTNPIWTARNEILCSNETKIETSGLNLMCLSWRKTCGSIRLWK